MEKYLEQIRREFRLLKAQGYSMEMSRSLIGVAYGIKISVMDGWKLYNNRG